MIPLSLLELRYVGGGGRVRVEELEEYMLKNLGRLMDECRGVCGSEGKPPTLRLVEGMVYEDCDRCLIGTAVDELGLQAFSLTYSDGRYGEFVFLGTHVLELTDETAQLIPVSELEDHLQELTEFGLLQDDAANSLMEWVRGVAKGYSK